LEADILQKIGSKLITKKQLIKMAEADFSLIPQIIQGTSSPNATVRYGCGGALMELSCEHPDQLYPYIDNFFALLNSKYRILTWNALAVIANLTAVDNNCKFDANFDKYYSFLDNNHMVTVANVVGNSAKIASNKPYLVERILSELLKVEHLKVAPHLTEECKLVIAQHAIKTFNTLINYTQNKKALIAFAQKHQDSPRNGLKKEALGFLKKWAQTL
jgi:hypothetical protein